MHAGKPQNQALAIAYSVKRKAEHHKMAEGGSVHGEGCECPKCMHKMDDGGQVADPDKLASAQDSMRKAFHYDEGGAVQSDPDDELHQMVGNEMMDAVHTKDHKKFMGGLEAMVLRCLNKKETYD